MVAKNNYRDGDIVAAADLNAFGTEINNRISVAPGTPGTVLTSDGSSWITAVPVSSGLGTGIIDGGAASSAGAVVLDGGTAGSTGSASSAQIQFRRATSSAWTSTNTVLAEGEGGYETDTGRVKVGDGTTNWVSLGYSAGPAPTVAGQSYYPPGYVSGQYYYCNSPNSSATGTLGNSTLRVSLWTVTAKITVTKLFAEFTVAGEANSYIRLGIWNHDSSTGKPSTLVLDAGTISTGTGNAGSVATGGTPGVYEVSITNSGISLSPGAYWVGAAVQNAPTTQPTLRSIASASLPQHFPLGASLPAAGTAILGAGASQSGAFSSLSASVTTTGTAPPRIGFKVA